MTTTEQPRKKSRTATAKLGPKLEKNPAAVIATTLAMITFAVYFLVPLWWLLVASTKSQGELLSGNGLWFGSLSSLTSNISALFGFKDGLFLRWMVNTIGYAVLGAMLSTLISTMAGYALAKYVFPGREVAFNVILGGVLVPATVLAVPLFLLFSKINLTDTYWAVFLPSLVNPFGVYLARIYASASIPDELLEAARLDGAGEFRTFFAVSLRLMGPGLATISLFAFVHIWNNFFLPLVMLQDERLYPITLGLYTWNGEIAQAPELRGLVVIGSLISIIPLLIGFLAVQRFWHAGATAGAVK
jgi:multiple sugar transport system permease protein